jgi:hypothetical protein
MLPSVWAGDKIEFSAPGVSLEVPEAVRDEKELPKHEIPTSMQAGDELYDGMQPSSEVVIITTPKEKGTKRRDSSYLDDRDNNTDADSRDADSRYDNLDSTQRSVNTATNRWDAQTEWNPNTGSAFSERRNEEASSQDSLRGRMEALTTTGKADYQRYDLYGRQSSDSDEETAESSSFFHPESTGSERMEEGRYQPFYEQMKAINEQPSQGYSPTSLYTAASDLSRDPSLPPSVAEENLQREFSRGVTPEGMASAPPAYHPPEETRTVSQNNDIYTRPDPPSSPQGDVQSRPAILPFPKKPGSVFQ